MKDFYPFWGEVCNLKSEEIIIIIIIIISFINTLNKNNFVASGDEVKHSAKLARSKKNNIF